MIQPPITEFIANLKEAGYVLRVENDRLKVIHPSRPLTDGERQFIQEYKPNIIQALQDPPAQGDDWHSAIPPDTMRRHIEKEMAGWTEEHRQAQEDELKTIREYRQQRGPAYPCPAIGIPRAEVFKRIGETMERLGKIWPDSLEPDDAWEAKVWEAERAGNRDAFHSVLKNWETSETRRVETYMATIRERPPRQRRDLALPGPTDRDQRASKRNHCPPGWRS